MAKKQSRKTIQNRCDKNWSKAVRLRAGEKCEKCGAGWKSKAYVNSKGEKKARRYGLESHHIISRSFRVTRWSLGNGLCLCTSCHVYRGAHSDCFIDQVNFHDWLWSYHEETREDDFGTLRYQMIIAAKNGSKPLPMAQLRQIDEALKKAVL